VVVLNLLVCQILSDLSMTYDWSRSCTGQGAVSKETVMKNKISTIIRKSALPSLVLGVCLALASPVGAMAAQRGGGGGGGFHGGGGSSGGRAFAGGGARGFSGGAAPRGFVGGGGERGFVGGGGVARGYVGRPGFYGRPYGWGGGGVYLGFGAPYYGYGYGPGYAYAPGCGYYDAYGNWIPTACYAPPAY
jgi:hypothetical protein